MTISNQTNRISAVGSGATGQEVPFLFPYSATSDLKVYSRVTSTGAQTDLTETTNYTLTVPSDTGGTLTTVTAIETTETIHIVRDTPTTQTLDLEQGGSFNAENIEDAFDKNTKLSIENNDSLSRTLRFPVTDPSTSLTALDNSVDRAGKWLYFEETNGEPTVAENIDTGTTTVTPFAKTFLDDATALLTMATLQGISVVNVRNSVYGAVGDGVVDDSAAVQAAADGLANSTTGGGIVFFPPGVYRFLSTVTVQTPGIVFLGLHGSDSFANATNLATIVNATGSNAISGSNAAGSGAFRSLSIENLNFRTESDTGAAMIKIVGGIYHSIRDVGIWGIDSGDDNGAIKYTGYAIELDQVQQTTVERVFIKYYSEAAYYPIEIKNTSATEYRGGNIVFRDVQLNTTYNGFKIDGPRTNNNIRLENCKVASQGTHAFVGGVGKALVVGTAGRTPQNDSVGGAMNLLITNCEFEGKSDGCIELKNCEQVTLSDNWLTCDTVPAVKIEGNVRGVNYKPNYITFADNILDMDSTDGPIEDVVIDKQVLTRQRGGVITVVGYSDVVSGDIITLTVNNTVTILTEGVDWDAATSNNITASSILDAIEAITDIDDTATTVTDNAVTANYIEAVSDNSPGLTSGLQNYQIPTETINITEVSSIDYRRTWLARTEIIESIVCNENQSVCNENQIVTNV